MPRVLVALLAAALLALGLVACGGDDDDSSADEVATGAGEAGGSDSEAFKVGFLYIGPPGDHGWTFQHDEARKYLEENVEGVETIALDSVPEANSGPAIDQLVAQGAKMIFATSFGYGDTVIQKAQQYPDVVFEHATGLERADNVATYFVSHWQPAYLLGVMAGRMTESNRLGYVASFPIPEIVRDVNAYTLGAQSVNPDVKVEVVFINTWFDPPTEKQAARGLIDAGADVLFGITDSPSVLEEAAEHDGVYASTWNSDMGRFGPDAFLSAIVLTWGPYYADRVQQAMDGAWASEDYWGTMGEDVVALAPYGESVPEEVRTEIDEMVAGFEDGSFEPFVGPVRDQAGDVQIPEGEEISFEQFVTWDWFVEGVEGTLPR
ncbi:MAG TPA: BMP family ABC transporter substrate-binding protein [Gaiellaceae bacterium]|nr:BMP family ABC transporter substrate-binding protein [Gaiellaceae bacterium]